MDNTYIGRWMAPISTLDYKDIISKGDHFEDALFKPCSSSLYNENTAESVSSKIKDKEPTLKWIRSADIFSDTFFDLFCGISPSDIKQGMLGNCYFLAAVAALAEKPDRIEKIFLTKEKNSAGCYPMQGFISGIKSQIVVDDYFPCIENQGLIFSKNGDPELWAMLLEKAWSKVNGCYGNSASGEEHESLSFLTGAPWEKIGHDEISKEEAWDRLLSANQAKMTMVASCGHRENISKEEYEAKGLVKDHAYSLLNCVEIKLKNGTVEKLLQLRNPWGETEWNGPWGDDAPEWTDKLIEKFNHRKENDGLFFMPLESYLKYFHRTTICSYKDNYMHSYCKIDNPHESFAFRVEKTTKGYIGVCQLLERIGKKQFGDSYCTATVSILLGKVEGEEIKFLSSKGMQTQQECFLPVELFPGIYIAIVCVVSGEPNFDLKRAIPVITSYADHQLEFKRMPDADIGALASQILLKQVEKEEGWKPLHIIGDVLEITLPSCF